MNDHDKTQEELINELTMLRQQVTEIEQSANELRLHSEILQNMSEGVHLTRVSDGLFVFANPTFEQMFGYESGELIGKHVSVINAPTNQDPIKTATEIIKILNETGTWQGEIQNIKKDGTIFWCYATVTSFFHAEFGDVWISIHQDITLRKQAEATLQGKSENLVDLEKISQRDLHYLIHELQIHQIELEAQNKALRQAQHQIEEARDRFVNLYDYAPTGYLTISDNGIILDVNLTLASMLSIERSKLVKHSFLHFIVKEDQDRYFSWIRQTIGTDNSQSCTVQLVRNDNSRFYALLEGKRDNVNQSESNQYRLVVSDISELKQAENELLQKQVLLQTLIDAIPDYIFVKDREGRFIVSNEAHTAASNVSSHDDLIGKTASDIFPTTVAEQFHIDDNEVMSLNQSHISMERSTVDSSGNEIWVSTTKVPLHDDKGAVTGLVGISRDITERKHSEIAFQKSEQKYGTLVEESPYCIHEINLDRQLISMNPAGLTMMGVDSENDIIGTPYLDAVSLDHREHINNLLTTSLAGSEVFFEFTGAGDIPLIFSSNFIPIKDNHGNVQKVMGITQDITERKQAEEALLRQHTLLQTLIDAIPDYIFVIDREGRYVVSNKAHMEVSKVSSFDELVNKTASDVFPLSIAEQFRSVDEEVMSLNRSSISEEHRQLDSSGNEIWVSTTKVPLLDDANTVIGLVGISRDITKQRQIEHDLEEQRRLLRQIIDMNPNLIILKDSDGKFVLVNEAFCATVGKSMDEIIGKSDSEFLPNPAEAEHFNRDDQEVIRTLANKFIPEESVTYADGELHWHQTLKIPFIGHDTKPGVLVVATDITARKLAEEALAKERNLLSTILDNLPVDVYLKDRESRFVFMNALFMRGINIKTPEDYLGTTDFDLMPSAPEHAATFFATEQQIMEIGEAKLNVEIIWPDQDGKQVWTLCSKLPLRDAEGTITGLVGINMDITERKQMEKILRDNEERFRSIYDESPISIEIYSSEGVLIDANQACLDMFGVQQLDDLIGHRLFGDPNLQPDVEEKIRSGISTNYELLFDIDKVRELGLYETTKSGQLHLNAYITPLGIKDKKITGYLIQAQDITQRKLAEQAIIDSEKRLKAYASALPDRTIIFDRDGNYKEVLKENFANRSNVLVTDVDGKSMHDAMEKYLADYLVDAIKRSIDTDITQTIEYTVPYDSSIHMEARIAPFSDPQTGERLVIWLARDITERKNAEVEREQLLKSEHDQRLIANTLAEAALALASHIDTNLVLDEILSQVQRLVQYKTANIMLLEDGMLTSGIWRGYDSEGAELIKDLVQPLSQFATDDEIVRTRKSIVLSDTHHDSRWVIFPQTSWIKSHLAVPIILHDDILGILRLDGDTLNMFTIEDAQRLEPLANIAAIALNNARLYEQAQTEITERKQAEEALKKSEAFLTRTGSIAKIGGWELDAKTREGSWTLETYHIHEVLLGQKPTVKEVLNFYHPDDRPKLTSAIQKALAHGTPYDLELRLTTAKGNHIWINTICYPVKSNGEVVKLTGIFQDITESKQAEQALQASEKRYRQAEEIANIGGWERDFVNDVVIWSPGAYHIYGIDPSNTDLTHEKILDLIHPSDRDRVTKAMNTSRLTKEQLDVEYRVVHADQIIRIVRSLGEVRLNQAGEVIGLLGAMQDITERKQAETLTLEHERLRTQFQKEQEQNALIQRIIWG
jgi:PAS domain S-box-containing protein